MTALEITESHVLKNDGCFQLQRVVTRGGDKLLVKLAVGDDRGDGDRLLERELALLRAIGAEHGLTAIRAAQLDGKLATIYEDFDGVPLAAGTAPAEVSEVLEVAAEICAILGAVHGQGSMLLGFGPGSFLRSARSRRVVLADAPFVQPEGVPVDLGEAYWFDSPYLAYAAPEVFGRASLPLDHRADLYSLGGLLYHLLAGRPLFDAVDPSELIQCHLARAPRSLRVLAPAVPADIADGVLQLLAKDPRDRYASIDAFEHVIASQLGRVRKRVRHLTSRSERARRATSRFSTKLYGQGGFVDQLQARIRTVQARPNIVFLEGDAGIGKTTLLREVQRREPHACFCWGEFDRDGTARPLQGWTAALIELANTVLKSRTDELEVWRTRIQGRLGDWAPLIGALASEWQMILRTASQPPQDPLDASLNRLALAIHCLLTCYADDEAPVVLILDDLQWADASSLRILELVLTAPEPLNLLVLASVRRSDDGDDHAPAMRELRDRLDAAKVELATLHLAPWSKYDIAGFITDSLGTEVDRVAELAGVLLAKTHGNPFFVRELLRSLILQHTLASQPHDETWHWNKHALQQLPVTANVVAFLAHRIAELPEDVKHALHVCACLGHEVTRADFCLVNEPRPVTAELALQRAIAEGLIVQRGAPGGRDPEITYAFVHDRVLEAARGLLTPDASAALHHRLGGALLDGLGDDPDEERVYRIANHFNLAEQVVTDRDERYASATLDLRAGRLAKQRGAFSQALGFVRAGLVFLGAAADDAWRERFELTRALHEETAELALLNGELALMTSLCDAILARVESPLQKVLAYEIRICGLKAEKRFSAAVDAAREILSELSVELPRWPTLAHFAVRLLWTRRRVFAGRVERLLDLAPMRDERTKAAARIIQSVYSAAYLGRPELFRFLVLRHVNDSLRHGNEDYSAVTYTAFGVVLSGIGRFAEGTQLGAIGLELLERTGADRLKARAFMAYYSFIYPWQNHLRQTLPKYREGLEAGLAYGDFEYASYIMTLESLAWLHAGDSLVQLQPELERHALKIRSLGQERSILLQSLLCQLVHGLRSGADPGRPLAGQFYDEAVDLPRCLEPLDENLVFHHYLAKLMLGVFLDDHGAAKDAAERGHRYVSSGGFANYLSAMFRTYEALTHLTAVTREGGRRRVPRVVTRNLAQLERWADSAPMNFLNKYHLVAAERCRFLGQAQLAAEHFEKAIELAQAHGFVHEAALAQERAATFYFERGMDRLGREYLRDSYLSYRRWGADAPIRRLEIQHAQHFAMLGGRTVGPVKRAMTRFSETLDYRLLLKSSQAISGEILLPRLLDRLLTNILEHAGAQRAVLVLERRGALQVEAEAHADPSRTELVHHELVDESERLCRAVVQYCARMATPVVLADATRDGLFIDDTYVREHRPKSMLCTPILYRGKLIGLVYLENNLVSHVFTEARLEVVSLLAGQAAISITNAKFHALELEAQQAKINPHFLFNTLSSIADVAVSDGVRAEAAIVKLAGLYRYILTNSTGELVTLDQELEIVRSYLSLEQLRFGTKLVATVTVDGDAGSVRLPGLLIQPLVENSIRHGIAPKLEPGTVHVHAAIGLDRCCIVVRDNGDGGKHGTSGTGFGLRSVQERLALTYGQQFSFAISRAGGYRVEIEIPAGRGALQSLAPLGADPRPSVRSE